MTRVQEHSVKMHHTMRCNAWKRRAYFTCFANAVAFMNKVSALRRGSYLGRPIEGKGGGYAVYW